MRLNTFYNRPNVTEDCIGTIIFCRRQDFAEDVFAEKVGGINFAALGCRLVSLVFPLASSAVHTAASQCDEMTKEIQHFEQVQYCISFILFYAPAVQPQCALLS